MSSPITFDASDAQDGQSAAMWTAFDNLAQAAEKQADAAQAAWRDAALDSLARYGCKL